MSRIQNPFPFSDSNKRYHTMDYALKQRFGKKVCRISLNAGMTCPNVDGTKGTGGCSYCSESGSGEFGGDPHLSLAAQFAAVRDRMAKKWPDALAIAYFQARTNTYAPLPVLKGLFEQALSLPEVVGLSVSTRPDCIGEETAAYLGELATRTFLTVELGLQTVHDVTAERLNRCHSFSDFLQGYEKLRRHGVAVIVHLINGLPGEDKDMMLSSVREIAKLRPYGVKLHLLHVLKGTRLEREYAGEQFALLSREAYLDIICDQLALLSPQTVIGRLTGDGAREALIAPLWSLRKVALLNDIDKELLRRDSWQGKLYNK